MDWAKTNKKLAIFIPNYKRDEYLRYSIDAIYRNTKWSRDDFQIVIGSDGAKIPWSDPIQEEYNISSFALEKGTFPRNGCFIRNYFIKRCQSDMIIMLDPEILMVSFGLQPFEDVNYEYDLLTAYTKNCNNDCMVRTRNVWASEKVDFNFYKERGKFPRTVNSKRVENDSPYHIHHFSCIKTSTLKDINGYDEKFTDFGYEDTDLYSRLRKLGVKESFVENFVAIHLWHEQENDVYSKVNNMARIYYSKQRWSPWEVETNIGKEWGNG